MTTPEPEPRKSEPSAEDDESFLDEVFEEALTSLQAGGSPEPGDWLASREALRARVIETIDLAREVAVHRALPRGSLPTVAGYEIERELGSGSMGTVFLARQRSLGGRRVALKVLPPSLGLSAQSRARFLAEARALARVSHAGIVAVHDIVESDGVLAFAMDWIDGGSLARVVQAWRERPDDDELEVLREVVGSSRRLEDARATTWLLQEFASLARALHAVHASGLLHRDIKPANVLVRNDGRMLLSDFGLVRDVDSSLRTRTGQYLGTLAYSSPEQLRGERELDARSDVYSLGVSLYESLTLHRPFEGRTVAELLARIETGLYQIPRRRGARLPRDLETILAKAMEPDPGRRYASAEDLADDLERLLSFQPIRARPATAWTRVARVIRRNRRSVLMTSAASFVALAGSAYVARWWVERRLADSHAERAWRRAQVELIDPRVMDVLFVANSARELTDSGQPERFYSEKSLAKRVEAALSAYDQAIGFKPRQELAKEIDLERTTVNLAARIDAGLALPELSEEYALCCPETLRFARARAADPGHLPAKSMLADADRIDRRHLGLLALLLSLPELALSAWQDVAYSHPVDPLIDALEGGYYLVSFQPDQAFPLLRTAFTEYPGAGFLCLELADAALRTSRTSLGVRLIEQARSRGWTDTYWTEKRLEADLHALRGENESAAECYRRLFKNRKGSTLYLHYAHFLQAVDRPAEAVLVLDALNLHLPDYPPFHQELGLASEHWWSAMGEPTWRNLRRCLDDPALAFGALPDFLVRYDAAVRASVEPPGTWKHIQSPLSTRLEARSSAFRPEGHRLYDLSKSGEIQRIDLRAWRQTPSWIRTAHAIALVSPLGKALGPLFRWVEAVLTRPKFRRIESSKKSLELTREPAWTSASGCPDNRRRAVGLNIKRDWRLAWSVPCTRSVVAKDGLVFVQDPIGEPAAVSAIDLESGAVRWRRVLGPASASSGGTMAIVADRLFVPLGSWGRSCDSQFTGTLACMSLRDGSPIWTWDSGETGSLVLLQAFEAPGSELGLIVLSRYERIYVNEIPDWAQDSSWMVFDALASRAIDAVVWETPIGWRRWFDMPLVQRRVEGDSPLRIWSCYTDWDRSDRFSYAYLRSSNVEGVTLDPGTGLVSTIASFPLSGEYSGPTRFSRSPPVLHGSGRLFLVDTGGWLYGFDLENKTELWPRIKVSQIELAGSTVLDSGHVVVIDPSVPWLTMVSPDGRSTRRIDLPSTPKERGFLLADGEELLLATLEGWIHWVDPSRGEVKALFNAPGGVELSAAAGKILVRTGESLLGFE